MPTDMLIDAPLAADAAAPATASRAARRQRGDGRVFLRGGVWWVAYYHRGKEIRESAKTTDERKARKLLRERLRTAGTPTFIGPSAERVTFEDLAVMYLTDYRVNGRRSLVDADRNVRRLRDAFGLDRAVDLTGDRIAAYAADRLTAGMRPASVNRELAALRRMFSLAVRAGRLPSRPHIALLAEENAREGFLEPADFEAVAVRLAPAVADGARFAYLTGWRKGEVNTLEWRDVALTRGADGAITGGTIQLRAANSKNKRPRIVILRGELLAVVTRRAAARRLDCLLVFHRDGRPLGDFRKAWRSACKAAGVPDRLFHDLRRSAVRNMVRAGVPERVAMAVSGHKTRSIFDRYNIVSEDDLAAAFERTDTYVAERRTETPRTVALDAARRVRGPQEAGDAREHGQNTDNQTGGEAKVGRPAAVSA